jgi:hypothetical protein
VKAQCIGIVPKGTSQPHGHHNRFGWLDYLAMYPDRSPIVTRMYIRVLSRMPGHVANTRRYTYNIGNDPGNNHPAAARRLFPFKHSSQAVHSSLMMDSLHIETHLIAETEFTRHFRLISPPGGIPALSLGQSTIK